MVLGGISNLKSLRVTTPSLDFEDFEALENEEIIIVKSSRQLCLEM